MIADRVTGNPTVDTVSVDDEAAGAVGARHLIDLGHKDILIVASRSLSLANIRQRCGGASEVMRSHGFPEPAIVELGLTIDEASARLSNWFDENSPPTAIQALTNFTTLSVLTTLAERGLRMPARYLADWLRRLHLDERPSDALDRDFPAGARDGPGPVGNVEREDQRRSLAGKTCPVAVRTQGSRVDRPCPGCATRDPSQGGAGLAARGNGGPLTTNYTEFWVEFRSRGAGSIDPQFARVANNGRLVTL